jgi:hypothetical protein
MISAFGAAQLSPFLKSSPAEIRNDVKLRGLIFADNDVIFRGLSPWNVSSLKMVDALCQEYVELHQRYLVKGEDMLGEFEVENVRRRTNSRGLPAPVLPSAEKVLILAGSGQYFVDVPKPKILSAISSGPPALVTLIACVSTLWILCFYFVDILMYL